MIFQIYTPNHSIAKSLRLPFNARFFHLLNYVTRLSFKIYL